MVVPISRMSTMMSMVLTFKDMEGRKKADMELMDGLPDDGPHPEHQVGGHQVHQTKMWKAAHKSHLQAGKPEIMNVIAYVGVVATHITMTTVWRTTSTMARMLLADTRRSVQSGWRSMMKKVMNSENVPGEVWRYQGVRKS